MIVFHDKQPLKLKPEELAAQAEAAGLVAQAIPRVAEKLKGWAGVQHWRDRPAHPAYSRYVEPPVLFRRLERTECVSLHVTFGPNGRATARIRWRGLGVLSWLVLAVLLVSLPFWVGPLGVVALPVGIGLLLGLLATGYLFRRLRLMMCCLPEYRRLKAFWRSVVAGRAVQDLTADLSAWAVRPLSDPAEGKRVVFEDHRPLAVTANELAEHAISQGYRAEFWPSREDGSLWIIMRKTMGLHPVWWVRSGNLVTDYDMVSLEVASQAAASATATIRLVGLRRLFAMSVCVPAIFIAVIVFGLLDEWGRLGLLSVWAMVFGGVGLLFFASLLVLFLRKAMQIRRRCHAEIDRLKAFWHSLE